jgi:hypothetical protein
MVSSAETQIFWGRAPADVARTNLHSDGRMVAARTVTSAGEHTDFTQFPVDRGNQRGNSSLGPWTNTDGLVVGILAQDAATAQRVAVAPRAARLRPGAASAGLPWCDTSTPQGELLVTILAGFATFERHLIKARTDDGWKRAQACGVRFGRARASLTSTRGRIAPAAR